MRRSWAGVIMCGSVVLAAMASVAGGDAFQPTVDPQVNPVFAADARLECVYERSADLASGLTEGPAVAPDGSIYFTDMPFGRRHDTIINRFDPTTKQLTVFTAAAGKANGLTFDAQGFLLAADGADGGGRCIWKYDLRSGMATMVADRFAGKRFNAPNDLCVDRLGRIYFTDPFYAGDETCELDVRAVYRVDRDGRVIEITRDVEMPNGIAIAPDEKTLYVGDHDNGGNGKSPAENAPPRGAMRVVAFPLDADGRVAGPRRTLVDFGAENGPDGITVDASGDLYIACRSLARPGVLVLAPDGRRLAFLQTGPANQSGGFEDWRGIPSNVEFGIGADAHTLYVTIDKRLCRIATQTTGCLPAWAARPAAGPSNN
jgi:gluconolactonase